MATRTTWRHHRIVAPWIPRRCDAAPPRPDRSGLDHLYPQLLQKLTLSCSRSLGLPHGTGRRPRPSPALGCRITPPKDSRSHLRRRGVGGAAGGRGRPGRVWPCCDGACSASPALVLRRGRGVVGVVRRGRHGGRSMAVPEVSSGWPSWVLTSSLWTVCSRVSSLSVRVWAGGSRGAGTAGRCRGGAPDSPSGPGRGPDRCHARVRGAVRSGRKVCSPLPATFVPTHRVLGRVS